MVQEMVFYQHRSSYFIKSSRSLLCPPHLPGNMCYLQETTFNCGSVHKSLFIAWKYAERLTRTADGCATRFCLQGFKVVKNINIDEPCGSSNGGGCLQARVLEPLLDRKSTVESEFASYAERIFSIKACLENGKRPIYNFHQVSQEGWDAKRHQKRMDTLGNRLLPWEIERLVPFFENSCNEISAAYTLTANELVRKHEGGDSGAFKARVFRTPVHEETLLIAPICAWFDEVVHAIRTKLRDEILEMEIHALDACMDDVGWKFPDDVSAKNSLEHWLSCRLVQPVEQSGTAIREAFVREGFPHHDDSNDVQML